MKFDWDAKKAALNRRKHGVSFEEAITIFANRYAITTPDLDHSEAEEREQTIGMSSRLRVLTVVHTARVGDVTRIISARKATRDEAADYGEELKTRHSRGKG